MSYHGGVRSALVMYEGIWIKKKRITRSREGLNLNWLSKMNENFRL